MQEVPSGTFHNEISLTLTVGQWGAMIELVLGFSEIAGLFDKGNTLNAVKTGQAVIKAIESRRHCREIARTAITAIKNQTTIAYPTSRESH